jgi:acyl-CoA synthetase (AMP-forming)/AMP-acid ligase II
MRSSARRCDRPRPQFAGFGLTRSDAIAIVAPNSAEAIVLFLGAANTGIAAPLNPAYKADEFRFYLEDIGAKALVLGPGIGDAPQNAVPSGAIVLEAGFDDRARIRLTSGRGASPSVHGGSRTAPGDAVALVLHTSGTTSKPKLVELRHRNLVHSAHNIAKTYELTADDVSLCVMPLFHIHGLMASALATFASGGTLVVPQGGFDALTFWQIAAQHRATWYSAVPTIHQMLLIRNRGEPPEGARFLRFIRSSSSSLAPEVMRQLEARFAVPVIEAYGMTEAAHQMASNPLPPGERRPGTVGRATGIEIGIMDDDGAILGAGERGEVVVRGASITSAYAHNPEANAKAFTDGWFKTGDQGVLERDGYLSLVGRLKELINRGGEKIAPREIDEVLLRHPAVAEAVTFALPHATLGEEVAAAVVLKVDVGEKDLAAFARRHLADHKVPRKIYIVDQIPRTATGKIQRRAVAETLLAQ